MDVLWHAVGSILVALVMGVAVFLVWMNTMKGGDNPMDRAQEGLYSVAPLATACYFALRIWLAGSWGTFVGFVLASFVFGFICTSQQRKTAGLVFVATA